MYKRAINRTKNVVHTYTNSLDVYYKKFLSLFSPVVVHLLVQKNTKISFQCRTHLTFPFFFVSSSSSSPEKKAIKWAALGEQEILLAFTASAILKLETGKKKKKFETIFSCKSWPRKGKQRKVHVSFRIFEPSLFPAWP